MVISTAVFLKRLLLLVGVEVRLAFTRICGIMLRWKCNCEGASWYEI